ncbi:MAG: radical SAM/SPASM domain-containing protein [Acidobacteriota bacterium]
MSSIKARLKENNLIYKTYRAVIDGKEQVMYDLKKFVPAGILARNEYQKAMANQIEYSEHFEGIAHIGEIEINKNCNLNCIMCNTQASTRNNVNMPIELFEKVVIYMKSIQQDNCTFHTIGEPLLNPNLEEYLKILRKYGGITVSLQTNGQILHKRLDILCQYSDVIDTIRFSIDGASKETYEMIRKNGRFEVLIENLNKLKAVNKDSKYFNVKIDSVVSSDVLPELAYHMSFYSQFTNMENITLSLLHGCSLDTTYFFNNSMMDNHIRSNHPCTLLNGGMFIFGDGRVSTCCIDFNGDLVYGSFLENTPKELINNDKVVQLRRYHLQKSLPEGHRCTKCFTIDPRVTHLFKAFVDILVLKYADRWDVEAMQPRFNGFFELFKDEIPSEGKYLSLFN